VIALVAAALLFAAPSPGVPNPIGAKAREREELINKLRRDIFKVDRSIGETERLISKSRNAPYLPDLQFRLAELYVEKSRYVYYLQAETRPDGAKGALVSPETKLLKQKAVQLYFRLLREYPDFKDGDKVQFYLAHEYRELGQFDEMLKQLGDLIKKYPQSLLRVESEQILGDYSFDKADLGEAEKHYQAILEQPPTPIHDLARYKLGWIRINQNKHNEAVTFFEAAAASAPLPGVDPQKTLSVKREALLDLVYSYTEARQAKGALQYFEKLSESRATYALALDKLGNRYFIKQQYEFAIPTLRKLMEIQPDPELDLERAQKLYDSLKAAKGKVSPKPDDVRVLVRAAVLEKTDPSKDEPARKKVLAELEEMARDLSTQLHVTAQKKEERNAYLEAAAAYKEYLALFRPDAYVRPIMRNRAEALFSAKEYPAAARQYEELARYEEKAKDEKGQESAVYAALFSHFSSIKPNEVDKLDAFQVADARQALKLLGASYLSKYPQSEHAVEVKFNIARAYFEDGEYEKSAELFTAFALAHPTSKDAVVAGNLALDSHRQLNDFKGLEATANKLLGSKLPQTFLAEVKSILTRSRAEALDELALKSSEQTGDVVSGLLQVAEANKGQELGEKALYGAFTAARDKRELRQERDLGTRLLADYPKSQYLSDVLLTLGRHTAEVGRFVEAAGWFEQVGLKLGSDVTGLDGWLSGARLRLALKQYAEAVKALEAASETSGARKAEVLVLLAEARMKSKELDKARAAAEQALKLDKQNAVAAAILAEVQSQAPATQSPDAVVAALTAVTKGPNAQSEDTAKGLWYLGEFFFKGFKALPPDKVEEKVSQLQQLEGIYTQAASVGSAEWAVASLWRLGMAYQHLADTVEASPLPAGLSAKEVEQFRAAVKQQVEPIKQRADNTFKACLSRAQSLEVFTAAVVGCRTRKDDAVLPLPTSVPTGGAPAGLEELQRKAETTLSASDLEALGLAYLQSRQLPMAELTLARATEIEDSRASAHNALGMALLLQGDAMGARAAYGRALDADPTFEKARANLAALRCRFGDAEGAKRELSLLKEGGVEGADVDPEWRACQ